MALLEGAQGLDGIRELGGVLLEPSDAAILSCEDSAEAIGQHLEMRRAAHDLAEGLLVRDDVVSHQFQLVHHLLGEDLALALLDDLDLVRKLVEALGNHATVRR